MKWFKHYTDAHRGRSMMALRRKCGWAGVGRWWALLEICAERMSKESDEVYTLDDCRFDFDAEYLRQTLGFGNLHQTLTYLAHTADIGLTEVRREGDVVVTYIPKLLEYLDRDSRYTRSPRATNAPKNKNKSKRESMSGTNELAIASKTEASEPTAPTVVEPDQISGARRQEIRFKCQAEIREVEEMLRHFFKGVVPRQLRYQIPKILDQTSGNVEQVSAILTELWQQPKLRTGEGLNGSATAYAERVILNRFGIE